MVALPSNPHNCISPTYPPHQHAGAHFSQGGPENGGHVKHEAQGLRSSSMAIDGSAVTWGGGTSTGNTISSAESCQCGCSGMGACVNEWVAMECMCLLQQ